MQTLREGQTRAEVHKTFGKPRNTVRGAQQRILDEYWWGIKKPRLVLFSKHDGDLVLRHLAVLYTTNQVVAKFQFHEGAMPYDEKFASVAAGKEVAPEQLDRIQEGTTREKELLDWFGPPFVIGLATDGNTTLTWGFLKFGAFRRPIAQELIVTLNAERVVTKFIVADRRF